MEEPTARDIAEKLRLVLDETAFTPEEKNDMADMETDEALGLAYTLLLENGTDPDAFFREHGILEESKPLLSTETADAINAVGHPELERILVRYAEAMLRNDPDADSVMDEAEGIRNELIATPEGKAVLRRERAAVMAVIDQAAQP